MPSYKQVFLVRQDLKLPKGKAAAQVAHAAVEGVQKANKDDVKAWRSAGQKKIVLKIPDEKALYQFVQAAKDKNLPTAVITDAGKTVIAPGTVTCASIGPAEEASIDEVTGDLPMF